MNKPAAPAPPAKYKPGQAVYYIAKGARVDSTVVFYEVLNSRRNAPQIKYVLANGDEVPEEYLAAVHNYVPEYVPGPYAYTAAQARGQVTITAAGKPLAYLPQPVPSEPESDADYNQRLATARMLAASSELLAVCQKMLNWLSGNGDIHVHDLEAPARAAIDLALFGPATDLPSVPSYMPNLYLDIDGRVRVQVFLNKHLFYLPQPQPVKLVDAVFRVAEFRRDPPHLDAYANAPSFTLNLTTEGA